MHREPQSSRACFFLAVEEPAPLVLLGEVGPDDLQARRLGDEGEPRALSVPAGELDQLGAQLFWCLMGVSSTTFMIMMLSL